MRSSSSTERAAPLPPHAPAAGVRGTPLALDDPAAADPREVGAKAAGLARARKAGLPVLPGYVLPVAMGRAALDAGEAALAGSGRGAARRAALEAGRAAVAELLPELTAAVRRLGGRVIVRSSSPLDGDPRWAGAFATVGEVGPGDIGAAVRTCWASAFAPDPLVRMDGCGLTPADLGLAVLVQPELRPVAGGVARLLDGGGVRVTGVRGHPGPLLAGWAEGASDDELARLIGGRIVAEAGDLVRAVRRELGHDMVEWAAGDGRTYLLQSARFDPIASDGVQDRPRFDASVSHGVQDRPGIDHDRLAARDGTACLPRPARPDATTSHAGVQDGPRTGHDRPAPHGRGRAPTWEAGAADAEPGVGPVLDRGTRVPGLMCVPGDAAGPLAYVRPHGPAPGPGRILVCERPWPALAPLLFGARGVVAVTGPRESHLSEVARALGVPMLVRVPLERVTGPPDRLGVSEHRWAVIDSARSELVVLPDVHPFTYDLSGERRSTK